MILEILHDPQYFIPWEPWLLYSKVIQDVSAPETLSPKLYLPKGDYVRQTLNCSFHFLFQYPYVTPKKCTYIPST